MKLMEALAKGGPVGLLHAARQAWLERRLRRISVFMERERALHQDHMAALRHEWTQVLDAQQRATAHAGQFWKALS